MPPDVRLFVTSRIHSVAQLEALLVVRAAPEQRWTPRALARRLYIGAPHAAGVLAWLHREGLMEQRDDAFFYGPSSEALRREVDALAKAYPRLLIPITELIHAKHGSERQSSGDA